MNSKNITLPVHNKRISPLFDVAGAFLLVNSATPEEKSYIKISGYIGMSMIDRLIEAEVNIVICSAISGAYAKALYSKGVELVPGVVGMADDVIDAFLNDRLIVDEFAMPGCGWRKRFRGRQCPYYREIHSYENNKRGK